MGSTIEATLERSTTNEYSILFVIRAGNSELDFIGIDKKVPRKRKSTATWCCYNQYKSMSIEGMLNRLSHLGFNVQEFKEACVEMGWEKQVNEWRPTDFCAGCGRLSYVDDLEHNGGFCLYCALEKYANT